VRIAPEHRNALRILIDGYNLLFHPLYKRRTTVSLEAEREGLVGLVRTYAAKLHPARPIVVVFDRRGGGMSDGSREEQEDAWVRVEFATSADDHLVERVRAAREDVRRWIVVTSDSELAKRIGDLGACVEGAEEFLARLFDRPRRRASRPDAYGGKPAPPRGDALLRDLAEQSAPRNVEE
jgi:predicted RNA-binding protein with PIN domain